MSRWNIFGALFCFVLPAIASAAEPSRALEFHPDKGDYGAFLVTGISSEDIDRLQKAAVTWKQWFQVGVASDENLLPMAGRYHLDDEGAVFTPLFPWQAGLEYQACLDLGLLSGLVSWPEDSPLELRHRIEALPETEETEVSAIYPSADVLPENLLKFYLHFSAPMSRGGVYEHLQLLQEDGIPVELPFLELGEELWDGELRRLTLFLDPGRVKHGLKPNEDAGPVLEKDRRYTLRVLGTMSDANGRPLGKDFDKGFRTERADKKQPKVEEFVVDLPDVGTRDHLKLIFPEPLDHALLQRVIRIEKPGGEHVKGEIEIQNGENEWHFRPDEPWQKGGYEIEVGLILEDLAGNNVGRLFERDPESTSEKLEETPRLRFQLEPR